MGSQQSYIDFLNNQVLPKQEQQTEFHFDADYLHEIMNFQRNLKYNHFDFVEKLSIDFSEELLKYPAKLFEDDENNFNYNLTKLFNKKLPQSLKSLHLCFICCNYLEDRSLIQIAKSLPQNLEVLEINLFNCVMIQDQAIKELFQNIPNSIQKLTLNLADCSKLTNNSIIQLNEMLKRTQKLQYLDITLNWCNSLKDDSVKSLIRQIPEQIVSLKLNFSYCKKISYKSIDEMTKQLNKFHLLNNLELNFNQCNKITVKSIDKLINAVENHSLINSVLKLNECFGENSKGTEMYRKYVSNTNSSYSNSLDSSKNSSNYSINTQI